MENLTLPALEPSPPDPLCRLWQHVHRSSKIYKMTPPNSKLTISKLIGNVAFIIVYVEYVCVEPFALSAL